MSTTSNSSFSISRCRVKPWTVLLLILLGSGGTFSSGQERDVRLASTTIALKSTTNTPSQANLATNQASRWPVELEAGQFLIHSTVPAAVYQTHLKGLSNLPGELRQTLKIAITDEVIHVVVLEDRESLDAYVDRILPDAPRRQALYIRHRGPGLVLTYFHPSWLEDVRHECTHALLDASRLKLPVWLDEGLAEYFETAHGNPLQHASHLMAVRTQLRFGQIAELERLEQLASNATLSPKDYRDAWSVVAVMLNSSDDSRNTYCQYLKDLQDQRAAGLLSRRRGGNALPWREMYLQFFARNPDATPSAEIP